MMLTVELLLFVLLLPFTAAALYLGALALLALLPAPAPQPGPARRTFAVIVPAHNEEHALPALLACLASADYPADRVHTIVVADNSDDRTAAVARSHGVAVVERHDDAHRGKGFALAFGIAHLDDPWDAVVFIDADCIVSTNLFRAFDAHLSHGEEIIQAYYTMSGGPATPARLVRELALELVHRVRPRAKRWFGGSAGLKGSGICFSRPAIEAIGWTASGLAEDVEQHVEVLRRGLRVAFAGEAGVVGAAPAALRDASGQHRRWEAGRLSAARREALPLLVSAIRAPSLARLDAVVELLVPPVSLLGIALPVLLAAAAALGSPALTALAAAGTASLALYLLAGLAFLRLTPADLARCVAALPAFMLWKAAIYVRAATGPPRAWERTSRERDGGAASGTGLRP